MKPSNPNREDFADQKSRNTNGNEIRVVTVGHQLKLKITAACDVGIVPKYLGTSTEPQTRCPEKSYDLLERGNI